MKRFTFRKFVDLQPTTSPKFVHLQPTSSHYCDSPLVQGGLEILREVAIYLPSTHQNKELVGICDNLMRPKIYCPASFINGLFLQTSEELSTPTVNKSKKKNGGENKSEKIKWTEKQKDIVNFFTAKCKLVEESMWKNP